MPSVADFLIERLVNLGVKHVFGVPGDYCLKLVEKINDSKSIKFVGCTDENNAGFAADAYARVHGIGCVLTTYNVGTLKVANSIAGAYAERSPVIVLSGSPGIKERNEDFELHHVVKGFDNQKKCFDNITSYSAILDDATTAGFIIDEAFIRLNQSKQPVYLELPRDVAEQALRYDVYRQGTPSAVPSDSESLKDVIKEVTDWVKTARSPVILAGVQLTRMKMGNMLVKFAERHNIPMVTTLLSKSTVNENHDLFAGVYLGNQTSSEEVKSLVENSDCLLILGEVLSDMTLGFQSPKFTKRQTVHCSIEGLKVRNHVYSDVTFQDFCVELFKLNLGFKSPYVVREKEPINSFSPKLNTKLTTQRFFDKVQTVCNSNTTIVADIGECLFGSSNLRVDHHNYVSSAFYCSMGCAVPGGLGVALAKPGHRPLILVGDGAFQMSATEISTFLNLKLNPIICVLNNKGYTTERFLLDGTFNNIRNWNYHKFHEFFGGGKGFLAETEEQLEQAFSEALASKELALINVSVEPKDISDSLKRMVSNLAKRV